MEKGGEGDVLDGRYLSAAKHPRKNPPLKPNATIQAIICLIVVDVIEPSVILPATIHACNSQPCLNGLGSRYLNLSIINKRLILQIF
jgi:hypothetical protein